MNLLMYVHLCVDFCIYDPAVHQDIASQTKLNVLGGQENRSMFNGPIQHI